MSARAWAAVALAGACAGAIAGCEVSLFGSEPLVIGTSGVGSEVTRARACGEPDDARAARTSEDGCAERCRIDAVAGTSDCDAVRIGEAREGVATLDLGSADGVALTVEICDPSGVVLQIGDATSSAASSHDATITLEGTTLTLRASSGSDVESSSVEGFVPASGCSERTIVIADQIVYLVEADAGLCGTAMLRIDPPSDARGSPDARWYLALAGRVEAGAEGSGLRAATACFW